MSEKCYNITHFLNIWQIVTAFAIAIADGIYADGNLFAENRAYCGFQSLKGGFAKPVTITVFGTRPKGV